MRKYDIRFEDYPADPLFVKTKNKAEARKAANLYIRQWGLCTRIISIELVEIIKDSK